MKWQGIPGWFDEGDAVALSALLDSLPSGTPSAHIGVYAGGHLIACADALKRVGGRIMAVDLWAPNSQHPGDDFKEAWAEFLSNTAQLEGLIDPVKGDSAEVASVCRENGEEYGLVFLDAGHSFSQVVSDITAWYPLVRRGGILAGHDFGAPGWHEVAEAVRQTLPDAFVCQGSSVWWHRVP